MGDDLRARFKAAAVETRDLRRRWYAGEEVQEAMHDAAKRACALYNDLRVEVATKTGISPGPRMTWERFMRSVDMMRLD